jgi:hypothetical protein
MKPSSGIDSPRAALDLFEGRMGVLSRAAVLLAALPVLATAQFSAQPAIITLTRADSAEVAVVTVRNEGKTEQQFRFFMADFEQTADGGHGFDKFGKNPHTCAGRVDVFPAGAALLPGERQDIRVRMQPGTAVCWGVLMVEQQASDRSRGIKPNQQIAVKVYGVPATSSRSGDISVVAATADTAGVHVSFDFRNTGEAPIRPQGTVEIRDLAGEAVATVVVDAFSVLPAHYRHMLIDVKGALKAGRYVAVPILDFGTDYLVGGQGPFQVP